MTGGKDFRVVVSSSCLSGGIGFALEGVKDLSIRDARSECELLSFLDLCGEDLQSFECFEN